MPPRRPPHRKGLPLTFPAHSESIEARIKRLRPNSDGPVDLLDCGARVGTSVLGVASSSSSSTTANAQQVRRDAPVVRNLHRGSFSTAADALAQVGAGVILDELLADRHAKSSVAATVSWVNTWRRFHVLAFSGCVPEVPMIPITPRGLVHIAALFKSGGYRAFPNYLSAAKAMHVEAGFEWDQLLAHTGAWVSRSVLRGIGPARQSCSFNFSKLVELSRPHTPLVPGGPHSPMHFALLSSLFLLREVEASNALVGAWTFDRVALEITWYLPSGKTDHMALGPGVCVSLSRCGEPLRMVDELSVHYRRVDP
jgi:hypothetical protein